MTLLIGVDPGVNTGIAVYSEGALQLVESCSAIKAETFILKTVSECENVKVLIEDARLRTWFGSAGRERLKGVGSVNRDCSRWEEFCEHHQIEYQLIHSKNNKTKIKATEFKRITGWSKRTNEHGRDAAMLVYGIN